MLISNFNLCKDEWLELVFAKRNKEYGAFYIRQHSAQDTVKAMLISFVTVVGVSLIVGLLIGAKAPTERFIEISNPEVFIAPPAPPKAEPPKPKVAAAVPAAPNAAEPKKMNGFPPPIVTADPNVDVDLPKVDDATAVGPATVIKGGDGQPVDPGTGEKGGAGTGLGEGLSEGDGHPMLSPEKMPEPMNGMQGWTKFLQNTIRYPGVASTNGISGKVIVSFIVEKDGQLTNFKLERGQGYGLDEEAIRVLKLAKPWKPGMQNGRPVRVKLTLPIAFMLEEN
jgi:protein TonB